MCYSGCPYENFHGECTGMGRLKKGRPHCFNEMTDEEFAAEKEWYDDDDEYFF
jgi:hypothetical protein